MAPNTPAVGGSNFIGLIFTLLAIAASVAIGKRQWGKGRWLVYAGNIVLAIFALTLIGDMEPRMSGATYVNVSSPFPEFPLASKYGPVTNIYPYSADGTPLENVLLYDQDGRPLRTAMQLWWADGCKRMIADPKAADGVGVEFSYPKNYVVIGMQPGQKCEMNGSRPVVPVPVFPGKPEAPIAPEPPAAPAEPNAPIAPEAPVQPHRSRVVYLYLNRSHLIPSPSDGVVYPWVGADLCVCPGRTHRCAPAGYMA